MLPRDGPKKMFVTLTGKVFGELITFSSKQLCMKCFKGRKPSAYMHGGSRGLLAILVIPVSCQTFYFSSLSPDKFI